MAGWREGAKGEGGGERRGQGRGGEGRGEEEGRERASGCGRADRWCIREGGGKQQ